MRVALFFDGKNFYRGYKQVAPGSRIDFPGMADWLVDRVGGTSLWGAYYYTGVGTGEPGEEEGQQSLARFLDMLETQPGFFVKRFTRKLRTLRCPHCQAINRFTQENEVDTTMVADILTMCASGAFDTLVLVSGDADHAPALEGLRALGRQTYVATWGEGGLSTRLRQAAFDHIDLSDGLDAFAGDNRGLDTADPIERGSVPRSRSENEDDEDNGGAVATDDAFLRELRRAEAKFDEGYVGVNYFLTRWQGDVLEDSPDIRRRVLDRLVRSERVEIYTAGDGAQAIRELVIEREIEDEWDDVDDEDEEDDVIDEGEDDEEIDDYDE